MNVNVMRSKLTAFIMGALLWFSKEVSIGEAIGILIMALTLLWWHSD